MLGGILKKIAGLPDAKEFVQACLKQVEKSDLPDTPGIRRAVAVTAYAVGKELLTAGLISKNDLEELATMLEAWTKRGK